MMCCKKYPHSSSDKKLTKAQKTLIRNVWNDVREKIDEVGVETFLMFFNTHPEAMDSFLVFKDMQLKDLKTSVKLKEHSLKVTSIVDKCVSRLDDMDAVATVAAEQGARHAGRYVIPEFQKCLKESYINAIRTRTTIPWTSATQHAWSQFFDIIQSKMDSEMEAERKRKSFLVSFS
ncbi:hemoglobin subunit zeta-like [Physella acuta]|uniref:hemoglobin subunit zeta-like n=1 Tax=Physella acuta TaxID=109671 RepID=UPI0027DAD4FE|nr:hemoglobin subunit zeta-like [Physella acuta]